MTLVRTFNVGRFICHALDAGSQRLDGGAMFGVVPKPLWERKAPADAKNRIPLALRCLLVEHDDGPVLIDTGVGNKESAKFRDIYAIDNAGTHGPTRLEDALAEAGFTPADVRWVVNTHLHFDHAGGNTTTDRRIDGSTDRGEGKGTNRRSADPPIRLAFPNATYVVQEGELDFAMHPNERTAASYLPPNFVPVSTANRWKLVRGETELLPGIRLLPTPGHVPFHQSVVIAQGGETACFLADLVPTTAHLPLAWIMGYDLEPLVTLETKREIVGRAEAEGWLLVFEHEPDPGRGIGRVERDAKSFGFKPLDTPARGA